MKTIKIIPILLSLLFLVIGCGDGGKTGKSTSISISPASAKINAGGSVLLTVTVKDSTIIWPASVSGKFSTNSNSDTAIYTPPLTAGTYRFTVRTADSSAKTATASITVQPPGSPIPPPDGVAVDIGDNPVLGNGTAKVVMVEFTDYDCPYCRRYVTETFPSIQDQYIDNGKIRYVVMDYPLQTYSQTAAEASHCAADQGKFWEMHKLMMQNPNMLSSTSSYAEELELDVTIFKKCIDDGKYVDAVFGDRVQALQVGIMGTPEFIIGVTDSANPRKVEIVSRVRGAVSLSAFQQALNEAIDMSNP